MVTTAPRSGNRPNGVLGSADAVVVIAVVAVTVCASLASSRLVGPVCRCGRGTPGVDKDDGQSLVLTGQPVGGAVDADRLSRTSGHIRRLIENMCRWRRHGLDDLEPAGHSHGQAAIFTRRLDLHRWRAARRRRQGNLRSHGRRVRAHVVESGGDRRRPGPAPSMPTDLAQLQLARSHSGLERMSTSGSTGRTAPLAWPCVASTATTHTAMEMETSPDT